VNEKFAIKMVLEIYTMKVLFLLQSLIPYNQEINANGSNDTLTQQEKLEKIDLEKDLNMEEDFWKEKSRVKWHYHGDRNTAFFHKTAQIKQAYKKIVSLKIEDTTITDPDQIANHAVSHFTSLFTCSNEVRDNVGYSL
jgi:hypothetical protein